VVPTGEVVFWHNLRGYGFIEPDAGGPDVFFCHKDLRHRVQWREVKAGVVVEFEIRISDRGPRARDIRLHTT